MRCYDTISLSWSVSQNLCEKPLTDPHGSKLQPNEMNNDDDDDDDDEEDDDASDPWFLSPNEISISTVSNHKLLQNR